MPPIVAAITFTPRWVYRALTLKELGMHEEWQRTRAYDYLEVEYERTESMTWAGYYCGAEKFRWEKRTKMNYTRQWVGISMGLLGLLAITVGTVFPNPALVLAGAYLTAVGALIAFDAFWGGDDDSGWEPDGECSWWSGTVTRTVIVRVKSVRVVRANEPHILKNPVSAEGPDRLKELRDFLSDRGRAWSEQGRYDGPVGGRGGAVK